MKKSVQGGVRGFFKFNFFLVIWNDKLSLPQERASFSKLKSLCICIFSIIHNQVMANLEIPPSLFRGVIFRKVLGLEIFYFNQLVFREKQSYILNFVEIGVGVVLFFHFFGWTHREFPTHDCIYWQNYIYFCIGHCNHQ